MIFGYMRVSTLDQNLDRQEQQLKEAGCEKVFFEKVTGTKRERPELNHLLDQLRAGDEVIITDLTRLSRSTKDLIEIVELIGSKGANLRSLKESWLDTTTAHGKLMFTMFAGLAQFERDLISERTKEGLQAAAANGRHAGRPSVQDDKLEYAFYLYDKGGMTMQEIAEKAKISRMTLHRKLKERNK
ncbi:recombinase family protein [Heyndrickxia acidicola]|uniref:Recombinase family protein n=1 Tax=Heyndrickxia acidicola TaxID=209389 RepID=A0ABU6MDQ6_9BACI|nr:recombinase family protein [Heyndrickxia acidicola]MED1202563.1 recombinase family protein [Heyndrickxia acidicola]